MYKAYKNKVYLRNKDNVVTQLLTITDSFSQEENFSTNIGIFGDIKRKVNKRSYRGEFTIAFNLDCIDILSSIVPYTETESEYTFYNMPKEPTPFDILFHDTVNNKYFEITTCYVTRLTISIRNNEMITLQFQFIASKKEQVSPFVHSDLIDYNTLHHTDCSVSDNRIYDLIFEYNRNTTQESFDINGYCNGFRIGTLTEKGDFSKHIELYDSDVSDNQEEYSITVQIAKGGRNCIINTTGYLIFNPDLVEKLSDGYTAQGNFIGKTTLTIEK